MLRSGISRSYGNSVFSIEELPNCFQKWLHHITCPRAVYEGQFLHSSPTTVIICLFHYSHFTGHEVITRCGFNFISLMTNQTQRYIKKDNTSWSSKVHLMANSVLEKQSMQFTILSTKWKTIWLSQYMQKNHLTKFIIHLCFLKNLSKLGIEGNSPNLINGIFKLSQ